MQHWDLLQAVATQLLDALDCCEALDNPRDKPFLSAAMDLLVLPFTTLFTSHLVSRQPLPQQQSDRHPTTTEKGDITYV